MVSLNYCYLNNITHNQLITMNLYRHKENGKLYTIEHLILDIKHLNCNGFSGIYATPYKWNGDRITYTQDNNPQNFNPGEFVIENFDKVGELFHL